jgi:cation transport protein ChaC
LIVPGSTIITGQSHRPSITQITFDMSDPSPPAPDSEDVLITRETLLEGSIFARIRADAAPGTTFRSDLELSESLNATLARHDPSQDLYLFGYGSLMWNPAIHFADVHEAVVQGWSRKFCLWLYLGRGTPDRPGLMLALDRGGSCTGLAFRIPAADVRHELTLVWRREMGSGAYDAQWIDAVIDGRPGRVLAFVANRTHARYVGDLPALQAAKAIAAARGRLGTCLRYFELMCETLEKLKIEDPGMAALQAALDTVLAGTTVIGKDSEEIVASGNA